MSLISITRLARNLAEIVNRVAYRNESFTVMRGKRPVAELVPVPAGRRLADLPGILDALPRLADGDGDRFASDLESGRKAVSVDGQDPWAS